MTMQQKSMGQIIAGFRPPYLFGFRRESNEIQGYYRDKALSWFKEKTNRMSLLSDFSSGCSGYYVLLDGIASEFWASDIREQFVLCSVNRVKESLSILEGSDVTS